jgi:serine/threonine-protein kinase
MVMVYVPAGDFNMGSTEWYDNEQPVHSVVLDGFWIDATEVTNAQYRRCMEAGACNPPAQISSPGRDSYYDNGTYDGFPVIYVNWHQAETYCGWVGARLPTEAEWEYAARGNEARVYPWGNTEPDCDRANRGGCVGNTAAVGSYPAGVSWCGALDMAGNVWEWVSDWYGDYPSDQQVNPQGPLSGEHRVLRGGSWDYDPNNPPFDVHSAYRGQFVPADSTYTIGFRCAWGSE